MHKRLASRCPPQFDSVPCEQLAFSISLECSPMVRRPQFDRREVLLAVAAQNFGHARYQVRWYSIPSTSASLWFSQHARKLVIWGHLTFQNQVLPGAQTASVDRLECRLEAKDRG